MYTISESSDAPNCKRIHHETQGQLCKVYGWNEIEAQMKAETIVKALELRRKLLPIVADMCLEEANRVWDEIYDILDLLNIEIPEYIKYDMLWQFLVIEHNAGELPDDDEIREYWDRVRKYDEIRNN